VLTPYPQAERNDEALATAELLRLVEGHHLQMSKRRLGLVCAAAGPCCKAQKPRTRASHMQPRCAAQRSQPIMVSGELYSHARSRTPSVRNCQARRAQLSGLAWLGCTTRPRACTRPPGRSSPARRPGRRRARAGCSWPRRGRTGPCSAPAPPAHALHPLARAFRSRHYTT